MKKLNIPVISYYDLPEELAEKHPILNETSCNCYIKINIISKEDQLKYKRNFDLENWLIENYPVLEGKSILIEINN